LLKEAKQWAFVPVPSTTHSTGTVTAMSALSKLAEKQENAQVAKLAMIRLVTKTLIVRGMSSD